MTDVSMYARFKKEVGARILANLTEFGETPFYTREQLGAAGVDMILYRCSAYPAINAAALKVFKAIHTDGTQKNVLDTM